jgi:hypothetical protein
MNERGPKRIRRMVACFGALAAPSSGAVFLAASLFTAASALGGPIAGGGDVTIDNLAFKSLDGDSFAIAHVEFINTNLTKDEIVKLLTPDTSSDDELTLAHKLSAEKISIPSLDILGKDGSKIRVTGFTANHVDAGKIESFEIAAIDAAGTDKNGPLSVKSGALHVDGLDVALLLTQGDSPDPNAPPSRLGGLTLAGLDIVAPDPESGPGQTIHVAVGSVDLHNDYVGDTPAKSAAKVTGLVIEPSPESDAGKSLASLGYTKLELTVTAATSYQAEAKTLSLDDLTIEGAQMGSISFKAAFTDVAPQLFGADSGARIQAMLEAGVASIELRLVNAGLFEKALAYVAKQQGISVDELRKQWSTMAGTAAPVMLGGDPGGLALGAQTQTFIAEPKSLTIDVKAKNGALKAGDFMSIGDLGDFAAKLDISAAANAP